MGEDEGVGQTIEMMFYTAGYKVHAARLELGLCYSLAFVQAA